MQYIVKIDKCNRAVVWSNAHDGSVLRVEHEHLHNTKITSNAIHNKEQFEKSREKKLPFGRVIGTPQMLHNLLGYSEITMKNMDCIEVCTLPFEFRGAAKIELDKRGNARKTPEESSPVTDSVSFVTHSHSIRLCTVPTRPFTEDQILLLQSSSRTHIYSDKVSLFGVRPPELLPLVRRLGMYYEMFIAEDGTLSLDEITSGLHKDVKCCQWIDGLGRRIRLRKNSINAFATHLRSLDCAKIEPHSREFIKFFLTCVDEDKVDHLSQFVIDDGLEQSPIVVFSRIAPEQTTKFALHLLLVLGEYDTELEFKKSSSFRESFINASLLSDFDVEDVAFGNKEVDNLVKSVILEIVPVQPISTKKLDTYIVRSDRVLRSMLLEDCLPLLDLPPCMQTQLYTDRQADMESTWNTFRMSQIQSMIEPLRNLQEIPAEDDVFNATKENPVLWNPLEAIPKLDIQSEESYKEQRFALGLGKRTIDHYLQCFGTKRITKGVLFNGAPGAGKTYLLQTVGFYGMCQGLRVMTTALMAVRARTLGGMNLHRLLKWDRRHGANLFRLAQVRIFRGNLCIPCVFLTKILAAIKGKAKSKVKH